VIFEAPEMEYDVLPLASWMRICTEPGRAERLVPV
jgi:hypothetical protein